MNKAIVSLSDLRKLVEPFKEDIPSDAIVTSRSKSKNDDSCGEPVDLVTAGVVGAIIGSYFE